jgi:hypothetical protein
MFSCKVVFKFWKRDVFKEHSRIRLVTIYIPHTSIHMYKLIWLYDSTLFGSEVWLYNICIASMLFHAISTPMSSTISLVVGRERHNIIIALVRIHKYHIYWETWECHIMKTLSFILKTYKNLTCEYTLYSESCGRSRVWHNHWVLFCSLSEYRS